MNFKGIIYYLGLFILPISFFSFLNILYSSYFDYFLNTESYIFTLSTSIILSIFCYLVSKNSLKEINFFEQLILVVVVYFFSAILLAIPFYFSIYQITFINAIFEAFSGITGTGFTTFENIKYLDPTLIIWRSSSQWIGGLYFIIFLILFFSNSKFDFKLCSLVYSDDKSLNPEKSIKKISLKVSIIYIFLTIFTFILFEISGLRLFNSLNLSMTTVSSGGFIPANSLNSIIKDNLQKITLIISLTIPILSIYFFYNVINSRNFFKKHYEDFSIILFGLIVSLVIFLTNNFAFLDVIINVVSSISNSGISPTKISGNLSLVFIFLTLIGGSILSNTSGLKFLRLFILLKSSFSEIFRIVKPNYVVNKNILLSDNKINNEIIKLSFYIFICFFISLFILSSLLLFDNITFENAFKISILTLTNTTNSGIFGLESLFFSNLLTFSKVSIIIFMIIGKIELLSLLLLLKKILTKN